MISMQSFIFNDFGVNTYVVWDESNDCMIVDAACYSEEEKHKLESFILEHKLKPVILVNTHGHIDHVLGNQFVSELFNIPLMAHRDGLLFYKQAPSYGAVFGFDTGSEFLPQSFLEEGDAITCGKMSFEVIYVPGHAAGSICLYSKENGIIFTGDVLFDGSIGRTDLPTGNAELLISGIKNKLLVLPLETKVYPGHGPATSIGEEKMHNPYLI